MEPEVPKDRNLMEGEMGEFIYLLQVSRGSSEADLHHKYHIGLQPTAAEGDQIRIPDGRQAAENAVPGDDGYNEKVDRQTAGVRCNSFQTADILCRQDSRIVEAGRP